MCGIAGIMTDGCEDLVTKMMKRIIHRGPDANGIYNYANGSFGHQRLSIMDPTGGDQPIYSADRTKAIIANGEIYNYPQLRRQLSTDHKFSTKSDSESALHLYEEIACKAAEKLDGMFAFAISDGQDLYAARDAIGIKPLYYGKHKGNFSFASELKALSGIVDDIKEFPPGTWYHTKHGFNSFYTVPKVKPENLSIENSCKIIRDSLEESVAKRMMSDVPVGAFLSGGLDSSIICALMSRHVKELHTFSVGTQGSRDLKAAKQVADHIGSIHHEFIITPEEVTDKLPEIIYYLESFDQDLVRSAIPCYFTAKLAAKYVKVILTGEGADELFAGYTYYKDINCFDSLHKELHRSVSTLHNINLQRVDRLTMAHSLEARVPFLDTELIVTAQKIPADYKLKEDKNGNLVEKWILRKACEDLLPIDIVWRDKEQFDEGSGIVDVLTKGINDFISRFNPDDEAHSNGRTEIRSPEEAIYYKIFTKEYSDSRAVLDNVARWSQRN